MLPLAKLVLSVLAIAALGLTLSYYLGRMLKKPSICLFDDGYILTHPTRPAVAFSRADKANEFAQRARSQGVYFNVYGVMRGRIIPCGNTANLIIT